MSFEERDRARPCVGDGRGPECIALFEVRIRCVPSEKRCCAWSATPIGWRRRSHLRSQTTIPRSGRERIEDGRAGYVGTTNATLTNGMARSGYILDDASFGKDTFEVLSSRLQPGCAESSIVNGILGLIDGSRPTTHYRVEPGERTCEGASRSRSTRRSR